MEKIAQKTPNWAQVFMTTYLLWLTGATAQKVYFACGAVVDVGDARGLVLSPGFPYNYSSGTHCVWQFFVPVGYRLVMEILDFDVFESHEPIAAPHLAPPEEGVYDRATPIPAAPTKGSALPSPLGGPLKASEPPLKPAVKQMVVVQEQSTKMEMTKVSKSAKWVADPPSVPASLPPQSTPRLPTERREDSVSHQPSRGDGDPDPRATLTTPASPPTPTPTPSPTDATQQPPADSCPHDVLYISDLITFSSRFCGSRRPPGPPGPPLAFGSRDEMVEVIMELITTTHWGRGFALLFRYHNRSEPGEPRLLAPPPSAAVKMDALLAAVCGATLFAVVLTSALCVIFRHKLCVRKASSSSSNSSELQEGVPGPGGDVSELQLVPPNQPGVEMPSSPEDHALTPPGHGPSQSGSLVSAGGDVSQSSELELSPDGLAELELGTDEVFVISSGPPSTSTRPPPRTPIPITRPPSCPYTLRERFLRHSDTGPGSACDWPSPDDVAAGGRDSRGGGASSARPRAWSVRTFQDLLPPLPQLHRKWRSWNSTSPFTKLVDSAPAGSGVGSRGEGPRKIFSDTHLEAGGQWDSSSSAASFPLSQASQRQRRLNSASNLRRSRFTAPCFSLLHAPENGQPRPPPAEPLPPGDAHFPGEAERVGAVVFAIHEEEDRQPLVRAEHLGQPRAAIPNGRGPAPYAEKTPPLTPRPANGSLPPPARSDRWPWPGHAPSASSPAHSPMDAEIRELKSALAHSTANQIKASSSLSQSTVPLRVVGKEM